MWFPVVGHAHLPKSHKNCLSKEIKYVLFGLGDISVFRKKQKLNKLIKMDKKLTLSE